MPSRTPRIIGFALLAFALTATFVALRFPYERLARTLETRTEQMAGLRLTLGELRPYLSITGFGLEASDVQATPRSGRTASLERLRVRPALSARWLSGTPVLYIDITSEQLGNVDGAIVLAENAAWDGDLVGVDLAFVPFERLANGMTMQGRLDAQADIELDANGKAIGSLVFTARDGSLRLPGIPVDIPFKTFEGTVELGNENYADVESLALTGPMLAATLSGIVGSADIPGQEPLDMALEITVRGATLRPVVSQLGVPLGRDGSAKLQLTGTLSNPKFK